MSAPPFEDSRRLTGSNLFFAGAGAVLETAGIAVDDALLEEWRARVERMRIALDWPTGAVVARVHAHGASLALAAPIDQWFTATEVNEWALLSALAADGRDAMPDSVRAGRGNVDDRSGSVRPERSEAESKGERMASDDYPDNPMTLPHAPGHPAAWDEADALQTLRAFAREERDPALRDLADEAARRGLDLLVDDDEVTLGSGRGARTWPRDALPHVAALEWNAWSDVPIALVTGSNGKTTTTRLIAAMAQAHGWRSAHTCTDGVFVGRDAIATGDYSGPAGARLALRLPGIDAAVLETARGGILRRGVAPTRADVAVVTNISDDHFGEYGIDTLDDLAAVKLAVARPLGDHGTLVLNADDARLLARAADVDARLALFAFDADADALQSLRACGGATCGVRDGRLVLEHGGRSDDLGAIDAMPLTFGGAARYNLANLAAAALAAHALGIGADTLRGVLASFGAARGDNPGRLDHYAFGDIEVFVDYAHNPDGLRGLLRLATRTGDRRIGLLLGQAGNRDDAEIRELAAAAAEFAPARIVLKDLPGYLRGRADGEVPSILCDELLRRGVDAARIAVELDEWQAVSRLLAWARRGDTLVLPVHGKQNRARVAALLDELSRSGWCAGEAVPGEPA